MNADPSNPLSWIIPILVIIVLIMLSSFFALAEASFTSLNQFRMKVLADDGNKKAKRALHLYEKFDKTLITVLIGHNLMSVVASVISTIFFIWWLDQVGINEDIASIITTVVMTVLIFIFGDTVPKIIGQHLPNTISLSIVNILYIFHIIFMPFNFVFNGLVKLTNKIFKTKKKPSITEDDLSDVVEDIEEEGKLEELEEDIIQNSIDFDDTTVKEVFTPLEKMYAIDINNLTHESLHELLIKTTFSRIPIYKKDINNIIGVLIVRNYLKEYKQNPEVSIRKTLQKPYFVSTRVKIDDLIGGFRKNHTHLAIVRNASKVVGIITMEDILEELVGDMSEKSPKLKGGKK